MYFRLYKHGSFLQKNVLTRGSRFPPCFFFSLSDPNSDLFPSLICSKSLAWRPNRWGSSNSPNDFFPSRNASPSSRFSAETFSPDIFSPDTFSSEEDSSLTSSFLTFSLESDSKGTNSLEVRLPSNKIHESSLPPWSS